MYTFTNYKAPLLLLLWKMYICSLWIIMDLVLSIRWHLDGDPGLRVILGNGQCSYGCCHRGQWTRVCWRTETGPKREDGLNIQTSFLLLSVSSSFSSKSFYWPLHTVLKLLQQVSLFPAPIDGAFKTLLPACITFIITHQSLSALQVSF